MSINTINTNNTIVNLVDATEVTVFTLGEYNRLIEEGRDTNFLQVVRRQTVFVRICKENGLTVLDAVDWLEEERFSTSNIWTGIFQDTHGVFWMGCGADEEGVEAFGPHGAARPLSDDELSDLYEEGTPITETDGLGYQWVFVTC